MRTIEKNVRRILEINNKKRADYTSTPKDEYENFQRANIIASWFPDEHKAFAVLIGVKLARLGSMLTKYHKNEKEGKDKYVPNNEPIDDTFLDQTAYSAIWWSYFEDVFLKLPIPENTQYNPQAETAEFKSPDFPVIDLDKLKELQATIPVACPHKYLDRYGDCFNCKLNIDKKELAMMYGWDAMRAQYIRRND